VVWTSCDQRLLGTYVSTINTTIRHSENFNTNTTQTQHHSTQNLIFLYADRYLKIYMLAQQKESCIYFVFYEYWGTTIVRHKKFGFTIYYKCTYKLLGAKLLGYVKLISFICWEYDILLYVQLTIQLKHKYCTLQPWKCHNMMSDIVGYFKSCI